MGNQFQVYPRIRTVTHVWTMYAYAVIYLICTYYRWQQGGYCQSLTCGYSRRKDTWISCIVSLWVNFHPQENCYLSKAVMPWSEELAQKMFWVLAREYNFEFSSIRCLLIACPRPAISVGGLFERHGHNSQWGCSCHLGY